MRIPAVLFLIAHFCLGGYAQVGSRVRLASFDGTWVAESSWTDPSTGMTQGSTSTLEITAKGEMVRIRESDDAGSGRPATEIILNIDGSGETNLVAERSDPPVRVDSVTHFLNGVITREVNNAVTWESNEFPARTLTQYRLSQKGDRLIVTTILQGKEQARLRVGFKGPLKLDIIYKKRK